MGRTTKAEHERRITKMVELLALGLTRGEIIQYASEHTKWGVVDRTIDSYIQHATEVFKKAAKTDRAKAIGRSKVRLNILFKRNMKITDYKAALQVIKTEAELLGLNEPQRKEITGDQDVVIKVNMIPKDEGA